MAAITATQQEKDFVESKNCAAISLNWNEQVDRVVAECKAQTKENKELAQLMKGKANQFFKGPSQIFHF